MVHAAWLVVADGEACVLLRNNGDRDALHLEVIHRKIRPNAPARALSTGRLGRRHDPKRDLDGDAEAWGASAMAEDDRHRAEEERFARPLAGRLAVLATAGRFQVLIADPRARSAMPATTG